MRIVLSLFGFLAGAACIGDAPVTNLEGGTDAGGGMDVVADSMQVVDTGQPDTGVLDTGADAGTCISGTLGWWRGEDNTADETGQTHLMGSPNSDFSTMGRVTHSFDFDGVTMLSMAPTSAVNWAAHTSFSVTGWVNIVQAGAIMHHNQSNQLRFEVSLVEAANITTLHFASQGFDQEVSTRKFAKGTWEFFALTCTGTTLTAWVGNISATNMVPTCAVLGGGPVQIGRELTGLGQYQGLLDELAIYKRALSTPEVDRIYQNEAAGLKQCRTN